MVIAAALSFVIVSLVIVSLAVKPVNALVKRMGRTPAEDPLPECPEWPGQVPEAAGRCAYRTSTLTPTASATAG